MLNFLFGFFFKKLHPSRNQQVGRFMRVLIEFVKFKKINKLSELIQAAGLG